MSKALPLSPAISGLAGPVLSRITSTQGLTADTAIDSPIDRNRSVP